MEQICCEMRKEDLKIANWQEATKRLDNERKQKLPTTDTGLTIRRFDRSWKVLHKNRIQRTSSGLVEQQALFRILDKR